MNTDMKPGTKIKSRDGKLTGRTTGGTRRCQLEGCSGTRVAVKWPDGNITWPCSEGLIQTGRFTLRIR
jgi:hypothetical protein